MIDLRPAADRLGVLIASVPDADLSQPTPCRDYSVGDLLDHIGRLTIAFGGAAVKAAGPSATMGPAGDAANLEPDWRTALPRKVLELAEAWQERDAWTGITRIGGGELPGQVAGLVTLGELSVHGWDLSRAADLPFEPDPEGVRPLFELVRQTFGPGQDEARGTAFGPAVPVAAGAPLFDRTLGMLGRDPGWASP